MPTLVIINITNNKIFGCFTPINWDTNGCGEYDINNQIFIFYLNLMKKFNMIKKWLCNLLLRKL